MINGSGVGVKRSISTLARSWRGRRATRVRFLVRLRTRSAGNSRSALSVTDNPSVVV